MKKMLFVVPDISRSGGSERVTTNLANNFAKNYDVSILTQNQENNNIFFPIDSSVEIFNINVDGELPHILDRMGKFRTFFKHLLTITLLSKHFKAYKYDFIMGMSAFINWELALLKPDCKLFLCEHRNYMQMNTFYRTMQKFTYKRATSVVVLSDSQKAQYPKKIKNISVIPNYVPFDIKKNALSSNIIRYIGRIDKEKRVDWLAKAFIEFNHQMKEYSLEIAGKGDDIGSLKEYLAHSKINFLGLANNVEELWENCDIAVLPSGSEAFPLTILEAMSKGVVFIGFNVPGTKDLIIDDHTGILVDENEGYIGLGKALVRLVNDRELLRLYSNQATHEVKKYSMKTVMAKWYSLFE